MEGVIAGGVSILVMALIAVFAGIVTTIAVVSGAASKQEENDD